MQARDSKGRVLPKTPPEPVKLPGDQPGYKVTEALALRPVGLRWQVVKLLLDNGRVISEAPGEVLQAGLAMLRFSDEALNYCMRMKARKAEER